MLTHMINSLDDLTYEHLNELIEIICNNKIYMIKLGKSFKKKINRKKNTHQQKIN